MIEFIGKNKVKVFIFTVSFVCISIIGIGIGIACDEQPRTLTSTPVEMTEFNELYESQKEYWSPNYSRNAALLMIVQSIDRLTDAIKEHECLSK